MFRVIIQEEDNRGPQKMLDLVIKTEKLYEILGRYITKYGCPVALITDDDGINEIEYHKVIGNGFISAQISYAKIGMDIRKGKEKNSSNISTTPPVVPEKPAEERIQSLVDSGAFKKAQW